MLTGASRSSSGPSTRGASVPAWLTVTSRHQQLTYQCTKMRLFLATLTRTKAPRDHHSTLVPASARKKETKALNSLPTRQSVTLLRPSAETAANLQRIAAMNNVPLATALEQAILNEGFIEEQTAAGAKLLIEKNGS